MSADNKQENQTTDSIVAGSNINFYDEQGAMDQLFGPPDTVAEIDTISPEWQVSYIDTNDPRYQQTDMFNAFIQDHEGREDGAGDRLWQSAMEFNWGGFSAALGDATMGAAASALRNELYDYSREPLPQSLVDQMWQMGPYNGYNTLGTMQRIEPDWVLGSIDIGRGQLEFGGMELRRPRFDPQSGNMQHDEEIVPVIRFSIPLGGGSHER